MKKFALAFAALLILAFSSASFGLEARGWRLTVFFAADENEPAAISEVQWLHDDDDDGDTPLVDGTESDLGVVACGWTRSAPNTGATGTITVGCDSVSTNRRPSSSITVPSGTRRTRLGKLMFDDNLTSKFETRSKVTRQNDWQFQYTWYTGRSAPGRTLPDVTSYSVTVPIEDVEDNKAPAAWSVQYLDSNSGRWVEFPDSEQGTPGVGVVDTAFGIPVDFTNAPDIYTADGNTYLVDGSVVRQYIDTNSDTNEDNWGPALTGSARTTALTAIEESGVVIAKRYEIEL